MRPCLSRLREWFRNGSRDKTELSLVDQKHVLRDGYTHPGAHLFGRPERASSCHGSHFGHHSILDEPGTPDRTGSPHRGLWVPARLRRPRASRISQPRPPEPTEARQWGPSSYPSPMELADPPDWIHELPVRRRVESRSRPCVDWDAIQKSSVGPTVKRQKVLHCHCEARSKMAVDAMGQMPGSQRPAILSLSVCVCD
jgi:hypothetical protein